MFPLRLTLILAEPLGKNNMNAASLHWALSSTGLWREDVCTSMTSPNLSSHSQLSLTLPPQAMIAPSFYF